MNYKIEGAIKKNRNFYNNREILLTDGIEQLSLFK